MKQIELAKDGTLSVLTNEKLDDVKRVLVTRKGSLYGWLFYPDGERPKGTWRHYEGEITCSECGASFFDEIMDLTGNEVPHYCPDCGAEMEEDEPEKEKDIS